MGNRAFEESLSAEQNPAGSRLVPPEWLAARSTAAGAARRAAASAAPAAGAEHGVARVMAFLDHAIMHRSCPVIEIAGRAEQVDTIQAGLVRADGDLGTAFLVEADVAAIAGVLLINNGDAVTV